MAKEAKTKYIILGYLRYKSLSGYEIKKYIEQSIVFFWTESFSQIYPTLQQMVKEALIIEEEIKNDSRGKKKYHITEKGEEILDQYLNELGYEDKIRNELLLKMFFSTGNNKETIINLIKEYRRVKLEAYNLLVKTKKDISEVKLNNLDHNDNKFYGYATLLYGVNHFKMEVDWCDEVLEMLTNNGINNK